MDRRRFLRALAGSAAAVVLDPERLLWVPGAKTIFLPPVPRLALRADTFAVIGRDLAGYSMYYFVDKTGIYVHDAPAPARRISYQVHP